MQDWQPSASLEALRVRAAALACVRAFFADRSVLEVDTPMLSSAGITAPELESYIACLPMEVSEPKYLHTSPEFFMKRLVAAGLGDCYQLCHVFRADEQGRRHNAEFMMLEWYRVGWSLDQLMDEVGELLQQLIQRIAPYPTDNSLSSATIYKQSYDALFESYLGFVPSELSDEAIREAAIAHCDSLLVLSDEQRRTYQRDDWLNLLFGLSIEPHLGIDEAGNDALVFVTDYPLSQAALARQNPHNPRTALRFECYMRGIELANGFDELTDARAQRQRFEAENRQRMLNGQSPVPIDERLLSALDHMPATSGVAVGFDRVLMLLLGAQEIAKVMPFTTERA